MKIAIAAAMVFFISSMTHAVDSVSDLDYCKVPFTDDMTGDNGTYRGQCKENLPEGVGTISFYNGDKLSGTFKEGSLVSDGVHTSSDGNVYKGGWQKGKRHGQGTYTWARGSSYEGEWLEDKRHGQGVFTWSNGNRFEGEFRDNKKYNGKYYTSTGRVYKCRLGQCR